MTADAERVFVRECTEDNPPVDLLVEFARQLDKHVATAEDGLVAHVTEVLEMAAATRASWDVMHPLARLAYSRGDFNRAVRVFEQLCALHPGVSQFHVEFARALFATGRSRAARTAARRALRSRGDAEYQSGSADDMYYRGYAHWLLRRRLRARRDFIRSGRPRSEWYERVCAIERSD